jgi:hypothetical protein
VSASTRCTPLRSCSPAGGGSRCGFKGPGCYAPAEVKLLEVRRVPGTCMRAGVTCAQVT